MRTVSSVLLFLCLFLKSAYSAEPRKLTFAYSSVGPMAAGVSIAKEAKLFDKYGVQAEVVISSGPVNSLIDKLAREGFFEKLYKKCETFTKRAQFLSTAWLSIGQPTIVLLRKRRIH